MVIERWRAAGASNLEVELYCCMLHVPDDPVLLLPDVEGGGI